MIAYALHILDTRKKGLTCSLGIACKRRLLLHIIFTVHTASQLANQPDRLMQGRIGRERSMEITHNMRNVLIILYT